MSVVYAWCALLLPPPLPAPETDPMFPGGRSAMCPAGRVRSSGAPCSTQMRSVLNTHAQGLEQYCGKNLDVWYAESNRLRVDAHHQQPGKGFVDALIVGHVEVDELNA
eukprot:9150923-Pyramimonas_sp.AAC.1